MKIKNNLLREEQK